MITLSKEQEIVSKGIVECFFNKLKITKLVGFAGTGKTTLILDVISKIKKEKQIKVAYTAFTGKASHVLKSKLNDIIDCDNDYCGTLHSLMYVPVTRLVNGVEIIDSWKKVSSLSYDYIIVDESSMLPNDVFEDLKSYSNVQILLVGDTGQLPPVNSLTSVLDDPTFKLEKIHRQAEDNPIIFLSKLVRENGKLPRQGIWSPNVFKLPWRHPKCNELFQNINFDKDVIVLCGFNKTRVKLNNMIRRRLGYTYNSPYVGEKLICLKNNKDKGVMNGQIGTLMDSVFITPDLSKMTINLDGYGVYNGIVTLKSFGKAIIDFNEISKDMFLNKKNKFRYMLKKKENKEKIDSLDFFEFAYCISVHKSQGSEWENVVVVDENFGFGDRNQYAKWLYTAITRSRSKLFLIGDISI